MSGPVTSDSLREPAQASVPDAPRRRSFAARLRQVVLVPSLAILLALVVGALIMIVSSPLVRGHLEPTLPLTAYWALVGGVGRLGDAMVDTISQAAPADPGRPRGGLGFKAGLFNIGAQGQFLFGALAAAAMGARLAGLPPIAAIPIAILAGAIAGAAYGLHPRLPQGVHGRPRGRHHDHAQLRRDPDRRVRRHRAAPGRPTSRSPGRRRSAPPSCRSSSAANGHLGILVALVAVPIVWWLLFRSTLGFEIRTVGANPDAARYAGMGRAPLIVLTMAICRPARRPGRRHRGARHHPLHACRIRHVVGFDAIAVALLGRAHPVGILLAGLLFGAMRAGAGLMQIQAGIPVQMINVLQAVILFFLAAELLVRAIFRVRTAGAGVSEIQTVTRSYGEQVAK